MSIFLCCNILGKMKNDDHLWGLKSLRWRHFGNILTIFQKYVGNILGKMKNGDHVWRLKSPRWQRQFPAQTKSIITSCAVLYAWDDHNVNIEIILERKCSKTQKAFAKQLWCLWSQTRAPNMTCICFFFFFFFRIFRFSSSVKKGRCKCKFLRPSARWA